MTPSVIPGKVQLQEIAQICVVVNDLDKAMARYWDEFGIGPWQVYTLEPPTLENMTVHERPQPYSMRLALAQAGPLQWELIQPLTGPDIYSEFLAQHGEGIHHVSFSVADYDKALETLQKRGVEILMGGSWRGASYSYMGTEKSLGTIVELVKLSPDFQMPPPEATYPPSA